MVSHGVSWCLIVSYGVLWCLMVSHGVSWCLIVSYGVSWCLMVSHYVLSNLPQLFAFFELPSVLAKSHNITESREMFFIGDAEIVIDVNLELIQIVHTLYIEDSSLPLPHPPSPSPSSPSFPLLLLPSPSCNCSNQNHA